MGFNFHTFAPSLEPYQTFHRHSAVMSVPCCHSSMSHLTHRLLTSTLLPKHAEV